MLEYIWLIPLFPLLGVITNSAAGKNLKGSIPGIIASAAVGLSFLIAVLLLTELLHWPADQRHFEYTLFTWIAAGSFQADIGLQLDALSIVMILVVTGVSFIIHIYAIAYMHGDRG